jgi:hypothetical protein
MLTPPAACAGRSLNVPALAVWLGFTMSTPSSRQRTAPGEFPLTEMMFVPSFSPTTPGNDMVSRAGS